MTRKHFTLIELLIVVGLVAMLLGIATPAFRRMMSGNRVNELADNIKLGLEQAQSQAVSRRQYVAIIFPSGNSNDWVKSDGNDYDATTNKSLRQGGFRLAEVTRNGSNYIFSKWVPEAEWRFPVEGARLLAVEFSSNSTPAVKAGDGLKIGGSNIAGMTGEDLIKQVGASLLKIQNYDGNAGSREKCALVFSPYGGLSGISQSYIYFYISGARGDGDNELEFVPADNDGNPVDNRVLKISKFTGRVDYAY